MSEDTVNTEGGLTRREMLKKSALIGAVAWTAPIVASFNTPAFAQAAVSPASCTHWSCGEDQDTCGEGTDSTTCLCTTENSGTSGAPFCVDGATACAGLPDCTTSTDCPPGWGCLYDSCCGRPVCAPPCGTPTGLAADDGATISSL